MTSAMYRNISLKAITEPNIYLLKVKTANIMPILTDDLHELKQYTG